MVSQTNERALEDCIEAALVEGSRYEPGSPADFDREFVIDCEKFWQFLETTQAEELDKLRDRPNWQRLIVNGHRFTTSQSQFPRSVSVALHPFLA